MDAFILNLLNSPGFQNIVTMFLVPLAVNSVSERLKALKVAIKDKTHEAQLLDCLEKAFFETERAMNWKHDTEAICETFFGSLMSFSGSFNQASLEKIFRDAVGADVTEKEIDLWIYNVKKQISLDEHAKLREFLYVSHVFDDSKEKASTDLGYLLTYTTPVWDNKDIICRDDIINELFAKFTNGTRRIQVAGMGGLGKTEILVKFFFQLNQPNPPVQFDYIGFIRFNDDLESDFRSQIPYLADYARKNGEEAAKLFLQQLCATNRVLFCIDDNRDMKEILKNNDPSFAFLKTLNASILFASRTEYSDFEQQDLPLLSTDACIKIIERILERELNDPNDISILSNIVENMSGNNTLIVNRLGYMILEHNFKLSVLQKYLQDQGFHIKKDCMSEGDLQQEINKLYPLSELTRPGERSIVEAFSIFPVNPLPIDLCVEWLHEDAEIDAEDCSLTLTRLSKQTWLEKRININGGEVLFSMHQCVKSAVKDQTTVEYSAHHGLVDSCRVSLNKSTNAYLLQNSSLMIPFAIQIHDILFREEEPFARLSAAIASFFNKSADYNASLEWYQKDLAISEKVLGTDHPSTATTYNNIAGVYKNQGHYDLALEWCKKDLAISEKVLGKEHPDTATTYNNIAGVYQDQGQYDLALEWYQKALVIVKKVLGEDHPYTASTYNNIALVYKRQGNYPLALEWYSKALTIREKVLGNDHPDTAVTYNNIAMVCFQLGENKQALEYFRKALDVFESKLGQDHPYTINEKKAVSVLEEMV